MFSLFLCDAMHADADPRARTHERNSADRTPPSPSTPSPPASFSAIDRPESFIDGGDGGGGGAQRSPTIPKVSVHVATHRQIHARTYDIWAWVWGLVWLLRNKWFRFVSTFQDFRIIADV